MPLVRLGETDGALGGDGAWWDGFWLPGTNGPIGHYSYETLDALAVFRGEVVAAGEFGFMDGVRVPGIASWNGHRWMPLGEGPQFYAGRVNCLTEFHDRLIAGGTAMIYRGDSTCVAEWDGDSWHPLGHGLTSGRGFTQIFGLAEYQDELVAAGYFTRAEGRPTPGVARWDGSSWHAMGPDSLHGDLAFAMDLAEYQGSLWASGFLGLRYEGPEKNLRRWTDDNWTEIPGAPMGWIGTLAVHEGRLLVAGRFDSAGGQPVGGLAAWDGDSWHSFGIGVRANRGEAAISRLLPSDRQLYVAGSFDSIGGVAARGVARWNGTCWNPIGQGFDTGIMPPAGLVLYEGRLIAGGRFSAGVSHNIAAWDGTRWGPVQPRGITLAGRPGAFLPTVDGLLVGGPFATPDDGEVHYRVCRWDGSSWALLGPPLGDYISSLAIFDGELIAAGTFDTVATIPLHYVAQLKSDRWEPMGQGMSSPVSKLLIYKNRLIAAGKFWRADGNVVRRIAEWDGAHWSGLAGGMMGQIVADLVIYRDKMIAVGNFTSAGSIPSLGIAAWDGRRWSSVNADFTFDNGDPWITHAATYADRLVVSGEISAVSQETTHTFAEWDGITWRPTRQEHAGAISYLGSCDNRIVAGGLFEMGNSFADSTYVLMYDGADWLRTGAGVWSGSYGAYIYPPVTAMGVWNGGLYLGGNFEVAGDKPSPFIARWDAAAFREGWSRPSVHVVPNPCGRDGSIYWTQSEAGPAEIKIFDIGGRLLRRLAGPSCGPGSHAVDIREVTGTDVPSGVY